MLYRSKQGLNALFAFRRQVDEALVQDYLSEPEMALFKRLSRSEQLHSIAVLKTLLQNVPDASPDLCKAALLHDIGKSMKALTVFQKTVNVLLRKFTPILHRSLSATEAIRWWNAPMVVSRYHPKWGAELLVELNSSAQLVWLCEHHQDNPANWQNHPYYGDLMALQMADNAN